MDFVGGRTVPVSILSQGSTQDKVNTFLFKSQDLDNILTTLEEKHYFTTIWRAQKPEMQYYALLL